MTYQEILDDTKKLKEEKEAYQKGEIDDGMDEKCREACIRKCN